MKTNKSWRMLAVGVGASLSLVSGAAAQEAIDKTAFLAEARAAYYNLPREGVVGFKCSVTPDWRLMADGARDRPRGMEETFRLLDQLHYSVALAPDGSVSFDRSHLPSESVSVARGLDGLGAAMKEQVSSFFDVWTTYVMLWPLPPPGADFQLERAGAQSRLTWKGGNSEITALLGSDFAARDLKVVNPGSVGEFTATFAATPKGLLLTDLAVHGSDADGAMDLKATLTYQSVEGAELPRQLDFTAIRAGVPRRMQLVFFNCRLSRAN